MYAKLGASDGKIEIISWIVSSMMSTQIIFKETIVKEIAE